MIVEVFDRSFWTRVQFPASPPMNQKTKPNGFFFCGTFSLYCYRSKVLRTSGIFCDWGPRDPILKNPRFAPNFLTQFFVYVSAKFCWLPCNTCIKRIFNKYDSENFFFPTGISRNLNILRQILPDQLAIVFMVFGA